MHAARNIFSAFISIALICTNAVAGDCKNEQYADAHPYECMMKSTTTLTIGSVATLGGIAAVIGALASPDESHSSGNDSTTPAIPTLRTPHFVGADVTNASLAGIRQNAQYAKNYNQYNDIRADYALARGFTGRGSNIAVLDANNVHGAVVSDLAGGTIAPNANVKFYQVANRYGTFTSYNEIGNQIAAATDAHIFNASWATSGMSATNIRSQEHIATLTDANFINQMTAAASRDAVFVFAAGNDGRVQSSALSALPLVVPELKGHFVNVVAYDSATGQLAHFSNHCGITQNYCIAAPGTNIASDASSSLKNGTSFAAPIVSAAIAVIREAYPYMTTPQITSLLFETAQDLGDVGIDSVYGHGLLDMERATRPVGVALVPVAADIMVPMDTAHVSGNVAHNIDSADLELAFVDSYGRPFKTKLSDNISVRNPGRGFARLRSADELSFSATTFEFGFRQSELEFGDGFMSANQSQMASFVGAHHNINIGNVALYHRTRIGFTSPRTTENSIISAFSNMYTADIRIGAKYKDWHAFVAIPETIISGDMTLRLPTGRTSDGTILYQDACIDMTGRPAVEYSIGYKNISASFIDNPYGTDEFFIMTRAHIQF